MGRKLSGRLTIAAVGKIKTKEWRLAQDDYSQRLQRYTTLELIEVRDMVGRGQPDAVAVQKEGEMLLAAAAAATRLIALTTTGQQLSSRQLADYLRQQVELYGHLAFLIGGPLGFSEELLVACHTEISLSSLTFTHEMARIILLEQLYRACTILKGEKYHK